MLADGADPTMPDDAAPRPGDTYLSFDGAGSYVEVPSLAAYSVDRTGALTVAAWIRADVEDFPNNEKGYVHWMGKGHRYGDAGDQEWAFRMYNKSHPERTQRTSFYLFNPPGGLGVGSYVQEPVCVGRWRFIVGMADPTHTYLYRNGERVDCDTYRGPATDGCSIMTDPETGEQVVINPLHRDAPVRIGTQNFASYFQGGITRVRIWGRVLTCAEVRGLYETDTAPRDGLAAEFLLDRDTGPRALDTASGNHGLIQRARWAVQT